MRHPDVKSLFDRMFDTRFGEVEAWFPNGKNSIRVRMKHRCEPYEFIFTYNSKNCWSLETVDMFIDTMM